MSKKTSNYIIGALIIIWLIILYVKFYGLEEEAFGNTIETSINNEQLTQNITQIDKVKKTTIDSLILDYNDPFLNKKYVKNIHKPTSFSYQKNQSFTNPSHNFTPQKKQIIKKPNIIFKGIIVGDKNLGIIKLNGKTLFVKEQEIHDSLFIKKITDSLIIISVQKNEFKYLR